MKLREIVRGFLADLGNRERVQPAGERALATCLYRVDQFACVFLAEHTRLLFGSEIERREPLQREVEYIQWLIDASIRLAQFDELIRDDAAEPFEIERTAFRQVLEPARFLRGAADVFTNPHCELRIAPNRLPARRALAVDVRGEVERPRVRRP